MNAAMQMMGGTNPMMMNCGGVMTHVMPEKTAKQVAAPLSSR